MLHLPMLPMLITINLSSLIDVQNVTVDTFIGTLKLKLSLCMYV